MAGKRTAPRNIAGDGEPLTLADGTVINADGSVRRPDRAAYVEVPSNSDAQRLVTATRRKLIDFPTPPQQLNVLAVVASYTLIGLADEEIALATQVSIDQVKRIKMTDAYTEFERDVVATIKTESRTTVRDLIEQHATGAVERIAGLVTSDDEAIALHASKDILDRAGHRPADIVEHRHSMQGSLRIEYVDNRTLDQIPIIDLTPQE